jgi:hypothetical protein
LHEPLLVRLLHKAADFLLASASLQSRRSSDQSSFSRPVYRIKSVHVTDPVL